MAQTTISFELNETVLNRLMAETSRSLTETLKKKGKTICKRLAKEVGQPAAQGAFGESVRVTTKAIKDGWKVLANGEMVCFLEFGTGAETDSKHPFASEMPFRVVPGSWSDSEHGAGTWSDWIDSGKDPAEYPYNKSPRRGMYETYKQIYDNVERIAIEVLLNDTD